MVSQVKGTFNQAPGDSWVKQAAIAIFVLLITITGISAWWFWHDMQSQLNTPLALESSLAYTIRTGMSLQAVTNELNQKGVLNKPYYLSLEARRQGKERQIKAGEYHIQPGTTPLQLLDQFIEGKVIQYQLTLVEGWNFSQVMNELRNNEHLVHTLESYDASSVVTGLGLPMLNPEGQFFPDTYHFPANTTDIEFLKRAYEKMQQVLAEAWEQRAENLPYQSVEEALVMASIIEKETGLAEEREQIAGVFIRRLQKGMLLQTDPTVIYAMGESFDGNIRHKDLDIDSPYNTYRYIGLPPTPIALAGYDAIHAALHPQDGNTLYFVAKGDGSHHFTTTLVEHNKAVAKYQLNKHNKND